MKYTQQNLQDIEAHMLHTLNEELGMDDVKLKDRFREDLDTDSMEMITIANAMSREFDIDFEDSDLEKIISVSDLLNMIVEKLPIVNESDE
jgi:acyl carrier protein